MFTHRELRFLAIRKLQIKRDKSDSNSLRFEAADYAIDLAMSPNRKVDEYLARNSFRDARRIITRQRTSARNRVMIRRASTK